jgi:hypothetical protein
MSIMKIEEVHLYVADSTENSAENIEANAFMDHSGIPYIRLFYNRESPLDEILASVNTWWQYTLPPVTKYPFITYVEVHDDIPARSSPVKYLEGIDNIKTFPDIYNAIIK